MTSALTWVVAEWLLVRLVAVAEEQELDLLVHQLCLDLVSHWRLVDWQVQSWELVFG